jgi:DNA polymerase elongation subunit (family B)
MNKCVIDIETESLDPKEGRIICIGVKDCETGKTTVFYDESEERMLKSFLEYYKGRKFTEIIGYNVLFDIRFIFAKCLRYGLPANGFFSAGFTDLMTIMKSVRKIYCYNKPGTLDEWTCFVFGTGKKKLMESISNLYDKGKISQIIEYNKRDVEITYQLWERVQKVLSYD